ncbi:MAG: TfoX/Sxy family protein, partial [Clostridia bacterium]|nr:TfoX/Sxy family protein [Clostridia bacterium]
MASSKEYLEYVLEQLSGMEGLRCRSMMGEYLLYCRNKVVGGIYDDRLVVKATKSARALLPDAPRELPKPGGKELLLVTEMENKSLLQELLEA